MERRSTFRFRLPWSQSEPEPASKPSPQPSTRTTGSSRPTRQGTRSRTTSQPSSSTRPRTRPSSSPKTENSTPTTATSEKPSSPAQPAAGTQGRNEVSASTTTQPPRSPQNSAETKTPSQSTTTSETVTTPPQPSSEVKAPIQSSTTNAPASPKSETQTPTSTILQRPQSGPPEVAPSRTESEPLIPSQEQQAITSQSASPSDVATKTNVSQPSSPSLSSSAPQSREMNPKSSPTRNGPQVLSTDQLTPKEASIVSQTSNLPSGITSQEQLKDRTISQPPKQSQESSETSSKSDEKLPSLSEKEPTPTIVWPQSEQVELLKKEAISDTTPEAKDRSSEKVMQPSELSEVKSTRGITEEPSKISDSSRIISEPKMSRPLDTNIPETKEVKEVVQETTDKNYSAGEKIGGFPTSKEQPNIVFQSKQANSDNDHIRVNRVSNGKQTRTSAEQDIPHVVKDNISKFIHRMATGDNKQILEEGPVSVITLAGDNRGASMQLCSNSSKKGKAVHIHRGYKLNADESAAATTDTEGRQPNDARTMKDQELEAYMNCNVQGLNNSITFDSSIEAKSPGIHMSIPRMSSETIRSSEGTVLTEAHKAQFNVTRAQKHTFEPAIRGRCLEGLFFEPSDSDSDNHEKPQRHDCHVGSMEKRDNDIDIL